jgi:hypothetical protein
VSTTIKTLKIRKTKIMLRQYITTRNTMQYAQIRRSMATNAAAVRLAIVGSRDYTDWRWFQARVDSYLKEFHENHKPTEIISGGARGVDAMAKRYAEQHGIEYVEFPANWAQFGRSAGPIRNGQIVKRATHMLALPSRAGRGTQNAINQALEAKLHVRSYYVGENTLRNRE